MMSKSERIPVLLIIAGLAIPSVGLAQQPAHLAKLPSPANAVHLTLEQAKELALTNNKQLELGRLNVQEKQIAIDAAKTDYLPKLLGSATYLHFNRDLGTVVATRDRSIGGAQIGPGGNIQVPSVTIPGKTVTANVVNQDSAFGALIVAQPITKLIGVSALVDLARADACIASAQLEKGTRDLLSGVGQAFYGLVAVRRIHAALSLQAGMLEPILQAQPSAELRLAYLEVRKGKVDSEKQMVELTDLLNQLLGLPAGTCLELTEPSVPIATVASADDAALQALSSNPQICEAQQNITKAQAGLKAVRMERLPDVNIVAAYGAQNAADYIQPNFSTIGVTGSYLFVDWGKRRMVKHQRETQLAMAHRNVDAVAESVQLEARKAYAAFKQTSEQLTIANEFVAAHQQAEKGAKDAATMMTLKGATAKAQLEQMMAELNYRVAHAKLAAAIGHP